MEGWQHCPPAAPLVKINESFVSLQFDFSCTSKVWPDLNDLKMSAKLKIFYRIWHCIIVAKFMLENQVALHFLW